MICVTVADEARITPDVLSGPGLPDRPTWVSR